MQTTQKSVKASGLFFLIITLGTTFKVISLPALLVEISGRDLWISLTIMLLADLAILASAMLLYSRHKDLTFAQILQRTIGKIGCAIVMLLLGAFLIFRLYFVFISVQKYMSFNLYNNLAWTPFTIPLVLLFTYTAYSGLRAITRANQIFSYITVTIMILTTALFLLNTELSALLPICENGFLTPLRGAGKFILGVGDYLPVLLLLGRISHSKGLQKASYSAFAISSFICIGIAVAFYSYYQNISVLQFQGQILSDMGQTFKGSDGFSRFDVVIVISWLISAFLNLIVQNWATKQSIIDGLMLADSPKNNLIASLPSAVILIVLNLILFTIFPITNEHFTAWWRWIIAPPFLLIVPVGGWVLGIILKKKETV